MCLLEIKGSITEKEKGKGKGKGEGKGKGRKGNKKEKNGYWRNSKSQLPNPMRLFFCRRNSRKMKNPLQRRLEFGG